MTAGGTQTTSKLETGLGYGRCENCGVYLYRTNMEMGLEKRL